MLLIVGTRWNGIGNLLASLPQFRFPQFRKFAAVAKEQLP